MKKWALWKTILVVISSIVVVAGATVGAIFLANGNGQELIYPENIEFSLEDKLYNANRGQFEVTEDFQLVLKSTTQNVTQNKVTLAFESNYSENLVEGTISDGVIVVPKIVKVNEPFNVKLNRGLLYKDGKVFKDENGDSVNWINGGISNIKATSENQSIRPTSVRVAVDVPVYSIDVETINMSGEVINQITEGNNFYARAKFFPEASRYLYSDNLSQNQEVREKATYFETKDTTEVVFHYDEKPYFKAGFPSKENHIVGYTFKHADKQLEIIEQYSQTALGEELFNTILSYLSSTPNDSVTNKLNPTNIEIIEASIEEFIVKKSGQTLKPLYVGSSYSLSVKPNEYTNDYLDAGIKAVGGAELNSMLKNIALYIEYVRGDEHFQVTGEQMVISGGNVVRIDGKDYILPNAAASNPYWEFYTNGSFNFQIKVVLLEEDTASESGYNIFAKDEVEQTAVVYLNSMVHSEEDLSWNDSSDIEMSLEFNGSTILPSTISLDGKANVPEDNIYQSGIYFACFDKSTDDPDSVLGSYYNAARSGNYTIDIRTLKLYALSASELTVISTGEFEIYFATVQTDSQGRFIYDENGLYKIAQITLDSVKVNVSKSLYQGSVKDVVVDAGQEDKPVYIYEGSDQLVKLAFEIKDDSVEVFTEQLVNSQIHLKVFNALNEDITSYFTFDYSLDDIDSLIVRFNLKVNDSLNLNDNMLVNRVVLYDDASKLSWDFNISTSQIILYSPKVKDITLNADIDFELDVIVTQKLSAEGSSNISILYHQVTGAAVELDSAIKFNALFNIVIKDQHDNLSIPKFNQGWTFVTDNPNVIVISQDRQSFSFGSDGEAKLWVACQGVKDETHVLTFKVESQGIMAIKKDASQTIGGHDLQLNKNSDDSLNTSVVSVVKNAKKDAKIELKSLIDLYLDQEATIIYSNVNYNFFFTSQFIAMNDNSLLSLFGNDGMLILNTRTEGFNTASDIRTYLQQTAITEITILHNFAVDQVLNFNIYDNANTGVIAIGFNLRIQKNISLSNMPSSMDAYAATPKTIGGGSIIYVDKEPPQISSDEFFRTFNGQYIVPSSNNDVYYLVESSSKPTDSIGQINDYGQFVFDDFWNDDSRKYNVKVLVDGIENTNALSFTILFNVKRNVRIQIGKLNNAVISASNPVNVLSNDEASRNLNNIIKVSRIDSDDSIPNITLKYKFTERSALTQNNNVLAINNSNFPFFRYNQSYLTEKIAVSICPQGGGEFALGEVEVFYNLGEEFSLNEISKNLYFEDSTRSQIPAKVEKVGDVNYLLVTSDQWRYSSELNAYKLQILSSYTENGITFPQAGGVSHYEVIQTQDGNYISFSSLNSILLGLNQDNIYLIVEIRQQDKTYARMLVPIIVSSIGMDFVKYEDSLYNNLQNAITICDSAASKEDTLLSQNIYQEVDAGKTYSIAFPTGEINDGDFGFIYPNTKNNSKFTTEISVISTTTGYYRDLKYKLEVNEFNIWELTINHLSDKITDAYLALRCDISNGPTTQTFYYLLKVKADTQVYSPIYPYNGGREEISSQVGQTVGGANGINLAEQFSVKTLHNGEYRFNVKTPNNSQLGYSYKINKVIINGEEVKEYQDKVEITFDNDNIKITPKESYTMELRIARVYDGGQGKTQSIVGGEIEYVFVLNSNVKYSLSYVGDNVNIDVNNKNNASITFAAGEGEVDEATQVETKQMKVYLNSVVSSGSSGHEGIVYGVLQAHARVDSGEEIFEGINLNPENELNSIISYNRDNANLTITRPAYVSKDGNVYIDFYTEYGYLGTLTIVFQASAQVEFKSGDGKEITTNAGVNTSLGEYIERVSLGGNQTTDYQFTAINLKSQDLTMDQIKLAQSLFGLNETLLEGEEKIYSLNIDNALNPGLNIMSSTQDFDVIFTATIEFTSNSELGTRADNKNRTYTFDFTIKVKANLKRVDKEHENPENKENINSTPENLTDATKYIAGNAIGGDNKTLPLYTDINISDLAPTSTNLNLYYKWQAATSSGAYFTPQSTWHNSLGIVTHNVPDNLSISVLITIGLSRTAYSAEGENKTDLANLQCYQTFEVVYTFNLAPNTKIQLNYPKPNAQYNESIEYLRDGVTFAAGEMEAAKNTNFIANKFFTSAPTLSKQQSRVVISKVEGANNENWSDEFTAYIDEMQNISVEQDDILLSTEYGNDQIDMSKQLSFHIGRRIKSENETYSYEDNGTTSYVVIRIECNGVLARYKVQLEKSILSLDIAHANSKGENKVETYYVNEMASADGANIFIDNRVIKFTLNDSNSIGSLIGANYRVVFEKTESAPADAEQYHFKDLYLTSDDCGKTKYVELGTAWTEYQYLGTYVINSTNFTTGTDGTYVFNADKAVKTEGLYATAPSLTSRAMMYYMGYKIDYEYLSDDMSSLEDSNTQTTELEENDNQSEEVTAAKKSKLTFNSYFGNPEEVVSCHVLADYKTVQTASDIQKVASLKDFKYNLDNGQTMPIYEFTLVYNYTVDIDIDIGSEFNNVTTYTEVYANQLVSSVIETNKLHHPSSGRKLERSELDNDNAVLSLEVVTDVPEEYQEKYIQEYNAEITNNKASESYTYLSISPQYDELTKTHVLDWRILGHGASNKGNFVLLKLIYTASIGQNNYTKEFPLVYKVLPDYEISYGNTGAVDEDEATGIIANRTNPYSYSPESDTYNVNIAGVPSKNNIVSVVHTQLENRPNVAASGFTYSITPNKTIGTISYNVPINLNYKLKNKLVDAGWQVPDSWQNLSTAENAEETQYQDAVWKPSGDLSQLQIANVGRVVFGSQYYRLVAKDNYGYTFEVYFVLQSGEELPKADESMAFQVTEDAAFDIGVVYEVLSLEARGDKFDIVPETERNRSTPDFSMLNLININAWGFNTALDSLKASNGDWDYNKFKEESDKKYLEASDFENTKVTKLKWLYNEEEIAQFTLGNGISLATREGKTPSEIRAGESEESTIFMNAKGETKAFRAASGDHYKMPKLPGWVYGTADSVRVVMMVELTYSASSDEKEVYNVPVTMTVNRNIKFIPNDNNAVRDGEEYKLKDYIQSRDSAGNEISAEAVTYYNDTLEVSLPAYSSIQLTITDGQEKSYTETISNNTRGYTKTQYVSISQQLKRIVNAGEGFTISVTNENDKPLDNVYSGYLIRYGGVDICYMKPNKDEQGNAVTNEAGEVVYSTVAQKDITITSITTDKINVPTSQELSNGPINVTKYYMTKYSYNGSTYTYIMPVTYQVTNNFYSMSTNYQQYKLVDKYFRSGTGNAQDPYIYTIPQMGWTDGMTLNLRENNSGGGFAVSPYTSDFAQNSIYFVLTDSTSSGAATISENGVITTTPIYNLENHFISVAVYCKASGLGGQFSEKSSYDKLLATVIFKLDSNVNFADEEILASEINLQRTGLRTIDYKWQSYQVVETEIYKKVENGNVESGSRTTTTIYKVTSNGQLKYLKENVKVDNLNEGVLVSSNTTDYYTEIINEGLQISGSSIKITENLSEYLGALSDEEILIKLGYKTSSTQGA